MQCGVKSHLNEERECPFIITAVIRIAPPKLFLSWHGVKHPVRTRFLAVSFFTATLPLLYPQDTPAVPATSPSPELPAALKNLEGLWVGTALHQSESAEIAYEFGLYKGKLLAKEWLPKLHVFGAPVGYVAEKATGFTIPGLDLDFSIEDDHLIGEFGLTELPIRLERSNRALPTETVPPASESIPKIAWSYQAPGGIWANPVAAGSTVVVGDSGGHLQALDGTNGQRRWLFDAQSPLHGEPAVAGDAVYFLADNGRLFKVTLSSGKLIWKADLGGGGKRSLPGSPDGWDYSSAGPVVADGKIYIGGGDGTFHALDAENGKEIWKFKAGDKVRATALVTGNRVFFGSFDHYIYGLDRETGKQVWRFDTGSAVNTAPVLAEHKIVVGTRRMAARPGLFFIGCLG
ncbi:MAG: hypothetical protein DME45_02650 [Verrucomicrobia bacterium]|nr:MAG: hypothetical protein DME45_02650 [Verrucomicrobiota bacterium]